MEPTPFLEIVANHYCQLGSKLADYCFVFPNRRSSQFFLHYLGLVAGDAVLVTPQVTTITDFESEITHQITATPIQAIFALYHAYQEAVWEHGGDPEQFDRFLYWGNIIVRDFNDVDNYMVDAQDIFTNTKQLHEISTDYLTPELKEAIEHFFRVQFEPGNDESFWNHTGKNAEIKEKFLSLWELLYPIYEKFNARLSSQQLSTAGKLARDAAQAIKLMGAEDFNSKKYVFVGFSTLSTSEMSIFDQLNNKHIAEFCWDYNSPAFDNRENKATSFMDIYTRHFPSAISEEPKIKEWPGNISVIGIPSNAGQAKYAFSIVDQLANDGQIGSLDNAIDTAIVLPDEKLFIPLINSAMSAHTLQHSQVSNINVTLGYPLRSSGIVSLMRVVAKMHNRSSRRRGEFVYLHEDVVTVLSHPLIKSFFSTEAMQLMVKIDNDPEFGFSVPESVCRGYGFSDLFATIDDTNALQHDCKGAIDYIGRLQSFAMMVRGMMQPDSKGEAIPLQVAFIDQYCNVLSDLASTLAGEQGLSLGETSVFYLIDRLSAMGTIPFEGEPLAGLQVMGMLETRCLDFKNLIILSVNEKVYPRKFFSSSFIPINLRRAFCMSTIDHQEAMTAYYFYRLISRAQNVYLLYDSSTPGLGSGEYSRFVSQLDKVYGLKLHFKQINMQVKPSDSLEIKVPKTGKVKTRIESYQQEHSGFHLSASSIKEMLSCQLKFYLHHIEGLNDDNDTSDFMDYATFGTIAHDVLQQFYFPDGQEGPYRVAKAMIGQFIKSGLDDAIVRNIKRIYLHKDFDDRSELVGEPAIVKEGMKIYLLNVLHYDMSLLPAEGDYIEVIECEKDHKVMLPLQDSTGHEVHFNFDFRIDRLDRLVLNGQEQQLRIIDYKTGRDATDFASMSELFHPTEIQHNKLAIMQLLLYCNAYAKLTGSDESIQPIIYPLRDMSHPVIRLGQKKQKTVIEDYHTCNAEFLDGMVAAMQQFFDVDTPLAQCDSSDKYLPCQYCKFLDFCRRTPKQF